MMSLRVFLRKHFKLHRPNAVPRPPRGIVAIETQGPELRLIPAPTAVECDREIVSKHAVQMLRIGARSQP